MTYGYEIAFDGALDVDAGRPNLAAGVARIEFADGSYAEFDVLAPARLISLSAQRSNTGYWLVRLACGADLARSFAQGADLDAVIVKESEQLAQLGRAALIDHLAVHDRSGRALLWRAELLAALAPISALDDEWVLDSEVVGESGSAAAQAVAESSRELDRDLIPVVHDLCIAARRSAEAIGDRDGAGRFGTIATTLAANLVTDEDERSLFDHLAEDVTGGADEDEAEDAPLVVVDSDEEWDVLDLLADDAVLGGNVRFRGRPRVGAPEVPEYRVDCEVDIAALPEQVVVRNDAQLTVTVRDGQCSVSLSNVASVGDGALFLRIFEPEPTGEMDAQIRHIGPAKFDRVTGVLSADVRLSAMSMAGTTGPLLADFVDSALPAEVPTRVGYWARVTHSSFARLVLAMIDQGTHVPSTLVAHRQRVERAARAASPAFTSDAEEALDRAGSDDFTASLTFVTPLLHPLS